MKGRCGRKSPSHGGIIFDDSNALTTNLMMRFLILSLCVSLSLGDEQPHVRVARKTGFRDCSNTDGINMCGYESTVQMIQKMKLLAKQFPSISELGTIGKSEEGRPLIYIKIGVRPRGLGKPLFKYVGNMHGNEVVGRQMLIYLMEYLLENYGIDERVTRLVDSTEIWILPSLNPDGYETSIEGSCSRGPGRPNSNNVDLNRDFPKQFDEPQNVGFERLAKGRARETIAIMRWLQVVPFVLSANLHGGAVVASYPFDDSKRHLTGLYSASPDDPVFVFLAKTYSTNHRFMSRGDSCGDNFTNGITNGAQWYDVPGGMQDYNYVHSNSFEVTLELSCCKHPPRQELVQEWINNKEALLSYMEAVHTGIYGLIIDAASNAPVRNAKVHVKGNPKAIRGSSRGEYWRLLVPGTYEVIATAPGYSPQIKMVTVETLSPYSAKVLHFALQRRSE